MKVTLLTDKHIQAVKPLFKQPKFMSVSTKSEYFVEPELDFSDFYHESFVETYPSGLSNYHAYGVEADTGEVTAILSFYESTDDASWYWNGIRTQRDGKQQTRVLLDNVLRHNEENGRFKFYSMFPKKYAPVYRRLAFSPEANERYDYFDEFCVDAKQQCKFNLPWQILYTRTLVPVESIVRCTFLKQKYRDTVYNAGRL